MRPIGLWSMSITLSKCSRPFDSRRNGAGSSPLLLMCCAVSRYSVSLTSVVLPEPDTPVTQVMSPTGNCTVDVLQVVAARAVDLEHELRIDSRRVARQRDLAPAREILAGERCGVRHDLVRRALRDDLAAVHAGARAHVDDVVGREDRLLVVLDDDHGVAEVAQVHERVEQALVVALVQADRRLVEDVHHADEARADLAREPDALRLAAGQRLGAAVERQVVEPDVDQELQAVADLVDDLRRRSRRASPCKLSAPKNSSAATTLNDAISGSARSCTNTLRASRVQARAVAVGAGLRAQVLARAPRAPSRESVSR